METRRVILIGAGVGMTFGGLIPSLWGSSPFSFLSMVFSSVGAAAGIWFSYQLSRRM